jgi:hypothetical protein
MSGRIVVRKRTLGALLLMLLAAVPALGQSKTGTTVGDFLLIEPSARIAAMGNAGVALDFGLDAVYYNPAAVAREGGFAVEFDHSSWIAGITYDHVLGAMPLGKWGNAFATVTALNSGSIDVRTVSQPQGTGERYHVTDVAIGLGYGKEITDRFSAGIQVTFVQETVWNTSLATGTVNLGTMFRVSENGLHLGASLSNFGTQGRYNGRDLSVTFDEDPTRFGDNGQLPASQFTDAFSVPILFRVGLGLPWRINNAAQLNLALDAFHPNDNTESVSAGAELAYRKQFAIRCGYQNAFQRDSEVGLTAGGGVRGKLDVYAYRLDYGWADQGRLGSTHRFSLGLTF